MDASKFCKFLDLLSEEDKRDVLNVLFTKVNNALSGTDWSMIRSVEEKKVLAPVKKPAVKKRGGPEKIKVFNVTYGSGRKAAEAHDVSITQVYYHMKKFKVGKREAIEALVTERDNSMAISKDLKDEVQPVKLTVGGNNVK